MTVAELEDRMTVGELMEWAAEDELRHLEAKHPNPE